MNTNLKSILRLFLPIKQAKKVLLLEKNILVIEDNPVDMLFIVKILQKRYFHILQACNGRIGFQIAQEKQPDLIILDCILPDISGENLCREFKKDTRTQHIPVLFLTVENNNVIECFLAGASGYENKPTSKKMLLRAVKDTFDDPGCMMD